MSPFSALRKDFEVDQRFKDLSMKVDLIKDDARYATAGCPSYVLTTLSLSTHMLYNATQVLP